MAVRITRWSVLAVCSAAALAIAQPAPPPRPKQPKKPSEIATEVAALSGRDLEIAAKAADALAGYDLAAAHEALLDALALGLPVAVAVPALAALAKHPAPADVSALRRYAVHRNPVVRAAALGGLAGYPDPAARVAIVNGLHDRIGSVRAAAAAAAATGKVRDAVTDLLALLAKGEEPAARALAQLADPDLARRVADHYGKVPDSALALTLGLILKRADFGPDPMRVEIVRALAKIRDPAAVRALADYLDATPKNPPRPSRQEAELVVNARGGK